MADKKISALTSATTPLDGTEVLPIVQSGSTVKVAVSDLTAGRGISASSVTVSGLTANSAVFTDASKVLTNSGTVSVGNGGTGLSAGTSGGIPYFSSTSAMTSSAALTANALVVGGGAGSAPSTITTGTGVTTALGVNTGTAGAFVVNGGALGTPSSGTVTNLTGTASININGTVGATVANSGAFTSLYSQFLVATGASGVKTLQASTQDAVQLLGRAGGTSSYIATITPTTLTASRTVTLPDASTTVPVATQTLTFSGPTAARTITLPDANFTAARTDAANSFTGDQTLSTGNLIQGTAAKGVNFTANTGAAGKTSQLLSWYEEGTWTPIDGSGAGLTFSGASGYYTRIGRQVTVVFTLAYPATANASAARIGGLPFTSANTSSGFSNGCFNINNSGQSIQPSIVLNDTNFAALLIATGTSATNAQLTGATLRGGLTYFV